MAFNWTCPYCDSKTTINHENFASGEQGLTTQNSEGYRLLRIEWIVCPNDKCKRIALNAILYNYKMDQFSNWNKGEVLKTWRLLPRSTAKAFPDYIPAVLRNDYEESSAIVELSPKASATLARRCLQGIIRDFWKVSKSRLIDEINAIEDKVDPLTWKSIDAIRKVGILELTWKKTLI